MAERSPPPLPLTTDRLEIRPLLPGGEQALQEVFVAAGDYFLPITGQSAPDPDAASREIAGAAGSEARSVALLVERESGSPVGAIGWWRGHPEPDVALLGMLLVIPEARGRGLAREALQGLADRLRSQGIRRLRTGVSTRDTRARGVLPALRFQEMSIRDHAALGLDGVHVSLWETRLPEGP